MLRRVPFVDSHTGGEPTRLILADGPDLGRGPLAERAALLRSRHDAFRSAVVEEPRGSAVLVGALLVEPHDLGCQVGVIFFNDVSTLGMCGHGTIGVVASLAALGRVGTGIVRIDTPVGPVSAELLADGRVAVANVESWRERAGVELEVEGIGRVRGDVAWGGNWFFLAAAPRALSLELAQVDELLALARRIRLALRAAGITGAAGAEIDHVELVGPSPTGADARVFVLCPGAAWDRSPCGTGTSAKLACLAAEGRLAPGQVWRQESIVGSVFEATYQPAGGGRIAPTIVGRAHLMAEGSLILDDEDPFCWGLGGP